MPSDYDGDGAVDRAVFRPSNGRWYVSGQFQAHFGAVGDEPVVLDTNGDGCAEVVVYRPSGGTSFLFDPRTGASDQIRYGESGDVPIGVAPFRVRVAGTDPAPNPTPNTAPAPETSPETSSDTGSGAGTVVNWNERGRWPNR